MRRGPNRRRDETNPLDQLLKMLRAGPLLRGQIDARMGRSRAEYAIQLAKKENKITYNEDREWELVH